MVPRRSWQGAPEHQITSDLAEVRKIDSTNLYVCSVLNIMASMSTEIAVLRALLRFSRRRAPPTLADLLHRVGGDLAELQRALSSLSRSELIVRNGETARLSLTGLAVAVAAAANARRAKTVARPASSARVVSLVRRRRAA
jgi:hypothetical protein